jgi:hypothetical protein
VGPIRPRFEVDHGDPTAHQSGVLPRADMLARSASTWKQPVVQSPAANCQPGGQRVSRRVRNLERDGPAGLLLDPRENGVSVALIRGISCLQKRLRR